MRYTPLPYFTNLTLGKKISLMTAVGLLSMVTIFSFLGIRAVDKATDAMLEDRLTTARLVADYVDEVLGRALTELKSTAGMIKSDGTEGQVEYWVGQLENRYWPLSIHISGVYLLGDQGRVLWSKPEAQEEISVSVSAYPSLLQAVQADGATISGLISTPLSADPMVLLSSATERGQEGNREILVVAIDLAKSSIGGFVQPIRLGQTGYVEIVDQNGIVVARTDPGPRLAPFEKSDHSGRFSALIDAGEPTRGVCHTCHENGQRIERRDVLAFVPLSMANWGVVIRQSEEEALTPARELRQSLFLFGGGLVTVALLLIVITTRDVISRVRTLTTASQKIADGDLISPVDASGKDELGVLARTLDEMRARLRSSYEELERLHQDIKHKDEIRGELLHELLSVQEEERKRIARELHDDTSQVLASQSANLEAAISMLPDGANGAKEILRKMQNQSIQALEEVHRLMYELRPAVLDDLGLVDAIRWLAENNLERAGITVHLKTTGRVKRLDVKIETTLFRVIQEITHNIVRHAGARSVDINLHFQKGVIKARIKDDGKGFDVEEAINTRDRPRGLGLLGMKERVELVSGHLSISSSPGDGTEIDIDIPLK